MLEPYLRTAFGGFSFDLSPWSVNHAIPIATQMIISHFWEYQYYMRQSP